MNRLASHDAADEARIDAHAQTLHKLAVPMGDGRVQYFYTFGDESLLAPAGAVEVPSCESADKNEAPHV